MFLCTANSCRSQMAEGIMRELAGGSVEVHSAGLFAAGVHPGARKAMLGAGIDISGQSSTEIDEGLMRSMDFVITLCGHAEEACPNTPPEVKRLHWPIDDPVGATGTEDEVARAFARARDEIKSHIVDFLKERV